MADDLMRLSEYPEASDEQMTNDALMEVSVVDQETASGFESRKSPLSRLANYILNKYASLNLGGSARTVKAAIDTQAQDISSLNSSIDAQAQDISSINSITYFSCTDAGSYYDITRQNCYAIGKRVFISVELLVTTASPLTSAPVVIVPAKYRPATSLSGKGFIFHLNPNTYRADLRPALVEIGESGNIYQRLSSAYVVNEIVVIWAEYMSA